MASEEIEPTIIVSQSSGRGCLLLLLLFWLPGDALGLFRHDIDLLGGDHLLRCLLSLLALIIGYDCGLFDDGRLRQLWLVSVIDLICV